MRRDAGGDADVGEGPITVVAKEHVCSWREMQGADVRRKAVHVRNLVVLESEAHVVGHEQVQVPITVHIQEAGAGTDVVSHRHAGLSGHVGKGPVTVVSIKDVGPEIAQVDIRVAVVVIVANADPQVVTGIAQPGRLRHVSELPTAVVPVQGISRWGCRGWRARQGAPFRKTMSILPSPLKSKVARPELTVSTM